MKARIAALRDEWGEGGTLPTGRALAEGYGVARETVRQARREPLVKGRARRAGRGTVVAGFGDADERLEAVLTPRARRC
ncbi:hypothetical protein [Streptomyces sp. LX-29]|uniref:hypothetical protein n=1 Tax=Streptomyces sp. LX-29 TaxID=2900152 RepID=UPI00321BF259